MIDNRRRKWHHRPDGYLRGDDVYDPVAFGKALDAGDARQQLYPALMTPHHAHHGQQHPHGGGVAGARSPGQQGFYGGPRCPHSTACPVHQAAAADGVATVWEGGVHDCCPAAGGRRHEHVYETAASAAVGAFSTRCRGPAPVITTVDDSYLPPGHTQTADVLSMSVADQLFDTGRV